MGLFTEIGFVEPLLQPICLMKGVSVALTLYQKLQKLASPGIAAACGLGISMEEAASTYGQAAYELRGQLLT